MRRPIRSLAGALLALALPAVALPVAAHAQAVPDAEVGFSAFFNRDYANQFPGPELGEAEITHMDMTFSDVFGVRVNISHDHGITLDDPGMTAPWRVTVRRGGQVIADTMTRTHPQSRPPLQRDVDSSYPQAGDVVTAVGPGGYRPRSISLRRVAGPGWLRVGIRHDRRPHRTRCPEDAADAADRIEHGRSALPFSGTGAVTVPVPGGPTTSIVAQTSREVAPLDYLIVTGQGRPALLRRPRPA